MWTRRVRVVLCAAPLAALALGAAHASDGFYLPLKADIKFGRHRQEKFRWNHPIWSVGMLCLRMKQSQPESQWTVRWG